MELKSRKIKYFKIQNFEINEHFLELKKINKIYKWYFSSKWLFFIWLQ